jgi:hypothetical protein
LVFMSPRDDQAKIRGFGVYDGSVYIRWILKARSNGGEGKGGNGEVEGCRK